MAVSSVHGSTDATTQAIQQSKKNNTAQHTQDLTAQTNNTHQTQTKNVQQQSHAQSTQAPKPVVNGQGQKTGQIINATA